MTALWRCLLLFLVLLILVHLAWKSRWTIEWRRRCKVALTVLFSLAYILGCYLLLFPALSYIYLVPTHELIDGERRAFFVEQVGPRGFDNVTVALLDNKSGIAPPHVEKYLKIDPGPENLLAPRYFWFKPSSPWDEEYTIMIESAGNPLVTQHMIVRSAQHVLQFAVEVKINGKSKPVFICRDRLMPKSYSLASGASEACDRRMAVPSQLESKLEPAPYGRQLPSGDYVVLRLRTLPEPHGLEAQSETRHLWEYEKAIVKSEVDAYSGAKLLILATSGRNIKSYAKEFRGVFLSAGWTVYGPRSVPQVDEGMIDVQVSADNGMPPRPEVLAVSRGLDKAGIKHRSHYILDPDVPHGLIVLWVGVKSPDGFSPDDCAPISFKPHKGEQPCAMISQSARPLPFPPL